MLPEIFKTDATKKKELWDFMAKNRILCDADKYAYKVGDTVYVLQGEKKVHDNTPELVTKSLTDLIVATITHNGNHDDKTYGISVKFDTGKTWALHRAGYCIPTSIVNDYLLKHTPKVELNTSYLDKLVLPPEDKAEIVNVIKQHHNLSKIFDEWGLNEIIDYGRSMSMLFYGPPGTGKTWGANLIAKTLGKELLNVSAANIQTSEPGGANRNIEEAFATAKKKGQVLFLDECDGLITDRSHVGMILASEINTLLTCLEKFDGVVIFATNRADTLDPAMARRISLMVEFKLPSEKEREAIWEVLLPKKMPLAKDVTIKKLAKFDLSGGYIKNAILNAARTAAGEEASEVKMKHFALAIKRIKDTKDIMGTHTSRQQDFVKARG